MLIACMYMYIYTYTQECIQPGKRLKRWRQNYVRNATPNRKCKACLRGSERSLTTPPVLRTIKRPCQLSRSATWYVHVYVYIYIYTCMYIYIYIRVYRYSCMCVCVMCICACIKYACFIGHTYEGVRGASASHRIWRRV